MIILSIGYLCKSLKQWFNWKVDYFKVPELVVLKYILYFNITLQNKYLNSFA